MCLATSSRYLHESSWRIHRSSARRGSGLRPSSSPNFILGYSDTETVKLDFDQTPFRVVKYWADRTASRFKLDGYLILKSSENSYHVVFNRTVTWTENLKIVAWVCLYSHHRMLLQWLLMQCIKQSSTLRVSSKGNKPPPRIVQRYGKQDGQITSFLGFRILTKRTIQQLSTQKNEMCFSKPFMRE